MRLFIGHWQKRLRPLPYLSSPSMTESALMDNFIADEDFIRLAEQVKGDQKRNCKPRPVVLFELLTLIAFLNFRARSWIGLLKLEELVACQHDQCG